MTFNVRRTASGCLLAGVLLMPMVVSRSSAQITSKEKATGGSEGGKCQVTAGSNKGKTGTFTEGGAWCEGTWGGTECGTSKCKAAAISVFGQTGTLRSPITQGFLEATRPGASPANLKAWEQQFNAKGTKRPDGSIVITTQNKTMTFDGHPPNSTGQSK